MVQVTGSDNLELNSPEGDSPKDFLAVFIFGCTRDGIVTNQSYLSNVALKNRLIYTWMLKPMTWLEK